MTDWIHDGHGNVNTSSGLTRIHTGGLLQPPGFNHGIPEHKQLEHAQLIASAPRLKEERDELLGGYERLANIVNAYLCWDYRSGKKPDLSTALKEANELIERVDRANSI